MDKEKLYEQYFSSLIAGDRQQCIQIIKELIDEGLDIKDLYLSFFKRSLYEIGELWESNKISVAVEHLATALTEYLMTLAHPLIFNKDNRNNKKAIVACVVNEYHQIGGKMIADVLELSGWDSYFLGANVPIKDFMDLIKEKKPAFLCLSVSIYFNIPSLKKLLQDVRAQYPALKIIVGGQAFRHGGKEILHAFDNVYYAESFDELEEHLNGVEN